MRSVVICVAVMSFLTAAGTWATVNYFDPGRTSQERRVLTVADIIAAASAGWTALACGLFRVRQWFALRDQERIAKERRRRGTPFGMRAKEDTAMLRALPVILPAYGTVLSVCAVVYPLCVAGWVVQALYATPWTREGKAGKLKLAVARIAVTSLELGLLVWLCSLFSRRSVTRPALRRSRITGFLTAVAICAVCVLFGVAEMETEDVRMLYACNTFVALCCVIYLGQRASVTRQVTAFLPSMACVGMAIYCVCSAMSVALCSLDQCWSANRHSSAMSLNMRWAFYGASIAITLLRFSFPVALYVTMIRDTRFWRGVGHHAAVNKGMIVSDAGVDALQPLLAGTDETSKWLRSRTGATGGRGVLHYVGNDTGDRAMSVASTGTSPSGLSGDAEDGGLPWVEWEDIKIIKRIGYGAHSEVYVGAIGANYVAIKIIKPAEIDVAAIEGFIEEALWTRSLQTPQRTTVPLYGLLLRPPDMGMVLELCAKGSLHDVLRRRWEAESVRQGLSPERSAVGFSAWFGRNSSSVSHLSGPWAREEADVVWRWDTVLDLCRKCARCVAALHGSEPYPVIHRDIKSLNFLVTDGMEVRLSDFGLARSLAPEGAADAVQNPSAAPRAAGRASLDAADEKAGDVEAAATTSRQFTGMVGSALWMAPEVVTAKYGQLATYGTPADVFSLSITMWEVLTGSAPYQGIDVPIVTGRVSRGELRPELPPWTPTDFGDILKDGWAQDPAVRPSAAEIVRRLETCEGGKWLVPSGPRFMTATPRDSTGRVTGGLHSGSDRSEGKASAARGAGLASNGHPFGGSRAVSGRALGGAREESGISLLGSGDSRQRPAADELTDGGEDDHGGDGAAA